VTRVARLTAVYAIAGGLLTLVGWATGDQRLTDWIASGISMFPNTAVCAVLGGLSLLASTRPLRATRIALASVVATIGGLTLFQHATGTDLAIDRLLFDAPWGQAASAAPMRMGPPASTSFLMAGTALVLLDFGRRARAVAVALGIAVFAVATLSLVGYLYGAEQLYTIPRLTGIALQTATILAALGVGIVASAPECEPMRSLVDTSAAGIVARRIWPLLVLLAMSLGWVRVTMQQHDLVDYAFGAALRTIVEIGAFSAILWWAVGMARAHDQVLQQSAAQIRRQASQLGAFLDTAAIALHRAGPDGTILWANESELALFGYAREEYVGHDLREFHVDPQVIDGILGRLHRGEKIVEQAARMRCKDGSVKYVLIDSSVFWDEGRFVHTQCFTRDVTERKRAEAEREEENRRKDEFLAILAHELRNPLAPVRTAAAYLARRLAAGDDVTRAVRMIERQVAQMSRLIDDLLDVSRMSRGALALRRERVLCSEVVEAAVEACRDEIDAKGHSLRTELPTQPIEFDADRDRLIQVLSNLLGNAAKYTPPAGRIELRVTPLGDGMLEMTVKDDGIGIPPDKLKEIFDLFARLDHSLGRQGGLGIGLTLARQLVELHGGSIEARSPGVGHGSEFVVRLPLAAGVAQTRAERDPARAKAALRVLVADDNRDAAESLSLLLESSGHEVLAVFDGDHAIEALRRRDFDVALIDIGMPGADGYEVARYARQRGDGRRTYLVALTGWGQETDKRRAAEAGFDTHLVKPVPPEDIERLLASAGTAEA